MEIITDSKWKPIKDRGEVPPRVLRETLDWCDAVSGFFRYRGCWYHVDEFVNAPDILPGWHLFRSDSFFSGVALRVSADCEEYQVATVLA